MPLSREFDVLSQVADLPLAGRSSLSRERLRRQAIDMVNRENLLEAAYSYSIAELIQPAVKGNKILYLDGATLSAPKLIPESGQLTALACVVATIGNKIERRITELFAEKRASLAVALDELANQLLFATARVAGDRIHNDVISQKLTMAGELHAGDPGLELDAQSTVLRLAQAHKIGVGLKGDHLMTPLKSGSMVFGVGIDLPVATWSRCDNCPSRARGKCHASGNADAFIK